MKKIVLYINTLGHGGAERVISNLATQFSESGYECILATSCRDAWEYSYGDKVRRSILYDEPIKKNFLIKNIMLVISLRKLIKKEKPDVLVSFMAEPNFRAILASFWLKTKVIISVRNDPNREYPSTLYKILAKILYRFSDCIVFQTEDAKRWFPKVIQKKSKIILNQVDKVFYDINFEGEKRDIITVGRLTSQKNHKFLIKAFSLIKDEVTDNLVIYGEGELRGELEQLIQDLDLEDRVFLPGTIKNVENAVKRAKLFVLSSEYEGLPNSLMEAMALGTPSISTDCPCGGPRMLFDDEKNGILCEAGNTYELAKKIRMICNNDVVRKKLGENAKERAKFFAPEVVFINWKETIDDV